MYVKIGMVVTENDGNHYVKLICRRNACWILKSKAPTQRSRRWKEREEKKRTKHFIRHSLCSVDSLSISPSRLCHYTWSQRPQNAYAQYLIRHFFFSSFHATVVHICTSTDKVPNSKGSIHKIADTLCKTSTFSNPNYPLPPNHFNFYLLFCL